jgi:hypothetical protein
MNTLKKERQFKQMNLLDALYLIEKLVLGIISGVIGSKT